MLKHRFDGSLFSLNDSSAVAGKLLEVFNEFLCGYWTEYGSESFLGDVVNRCLTLAEEGALTFWSGQF